MRRTKGSQSEIGMIYQYKVTTLFAALLSRSDEVDDYVIYSSEKSAGKYDDIIAKIKLRNHDDWYLSLVQVKYKETKRLNVSDNLKGTAIEYVLSEYIRSFNNILDNLELPVRHDVPSENIRFGIFCNKTIQEPVFLRQDCTFQLTISQNFNGSNTLNNILLPFDDNYCKFVCGDLKNTSNQPFLDRCCLYLEQPNYNRINEKIRRTCDINSAKEIINYVKDYFNNSYLYKQGLCKNVFELELQRIRCSKAVPPLTSFDSVVDDIRVSIWNKITLEHDITAVNYVQGFAVEPCLYSCLAQRVNTLLNINIDWRTHISEEKDLDRKVIEKFRAYSQSKRYRYWIDPPSTLQFLLAELWKCGDLPLILKTQSKINKFEMYAHLKRSYIVIDDWTNRCEEISLSKLKIFTSLSDVTNQDLQEMMLKNTLVSLQGRKPITLRDLIAEDQELMSAFTCADLLGIMRKRAAFLKEDCFKDNNYLAFIIENEKCTQILDRIEPYTIGHNITITCPLDKVDECFKIIQGYPEISQNYTIYHLRQTGEKLALIQGPQTKLNHHCVDQYGEPLFSYNEIESIPIIGQVTKLNELQYIPRQLRRATIPWSFFNSQQTRICLLSGDLDALEGSIEFSDVNEAILTEKKTYFVNIQAGKRQDYWAKFSQFRHPIFDVRLSNGKLDLLRSQHYRNLGQHISYDGGKYTETDFFDEIKNEANEIIVVTGDAGIGKTSFLKWMCNNYPTTDYIVFYDLVNLQLDLNKSQNQYTDLIDLILKGIKNNLPKKYHNFISELWRKKRLIWVLDSFDEMGLACEKQVLDFVQLIVNFGAQIVIATRIENCKILMHQFGIRLIKIDPLEEHECFVHWELSEDLSENVSSELLTNPLYLNFLQMISVSQEQMKNLTKFTLYEKVIHMKIRDCLQRTRVIHDSEIERTVSLFEKLALVAMFGKETIERELHWICDKEVHDLIKFGIVIRFDEGIYPIFCHRTFVEFLVAQWMTKTPYKSAAKYLYKQIFKENKLHMLKCLSEDIELHRAVSQLDISRTKAIIKANPTCWDNVDKLGRTALHTAVISCGYSSGLSAAYRMLEFVMKAMLEGGYDINKHDDIMGWNWSEYLQAEIFELACVLQKTDVIKIFLQFLRRRIDNDQCTTSLFPTKYFNTLFHSAIELISIDMIADLVWLQNLDNQTFRKFYQACLESIPESIPLCTKDFQLEGQLTPMHIACICGSIPTIQILIKAGADVNAADAFGCTPLYYSIMRCSLLRPDNLGDNNSKMISERATNEEAVKLLLEADATPDLWFLPTNRLTHLCLAIQTMNLNVVRMLLETGANICHRCVGGNAPLHVAAKVGSPDIVRCLLKYKAQQFLRNESGETEMDIAIKQNHTEIINLLRERKDSADSVEEEERTVYLSKRAYKILRGTPLHDAVYARNVKLIKTLLSKGGNIDLLNQDSFTPLHVSVFGKNVEVVMLLLSKGANVEIQDKYGRTPLFIATSHDNTSAVEMILEKGANPNISNMAAETPLFAAVIRKNLNAIKLLLKSGASVNVQNIYGCTPLYAAAHNGNSDIVKLLLENKADTEIANSYGNTPIHISILFQHKRNCELLLQKQAKIDVRNKQGATPLLLAVYIKDIEIVRLLLENGAPVDTEDMDGRTALHMAIASKNEEVVRLLLEKGVNINAQTRNGDSALFLAAKSEKIQTVTSLLQANVNLDRKGAAAALRFVASNGDIDTVRLLLSKGVNINGSNSYGCTPLHLAALKRHGAIVGLLLDQGANLNASCISSNLGYTPLHFAISKQYNDVVKLLINKGADINPNTKDGHTALVLAIDTKNTNIIKMLLEANTNTDYKAEGEYHNGDIIGLLLKNRVTEDIEIRRILSEALNEESLVQLKMPEEGVDLAKLLGEKGDDMDLRTEGGKNSPQIAVDCEYTNIVDILLDGGTDVSTITSNSILRLAARKGNADMVELLLNKGASIITDSISGTSLLHDCAREGNVNVMKLLLEKKIDLNLQDKIGNTALHIGASVENTNVVRLLLDRNADADIVNNDGKTPFHMAVDAGGTKTENIEIIGLLLKHMKTINLTDGNVVLKNGIFNTNQTTLTKRTED